MSTTPLKYIAQTFWWENKETGHFKTIIEIEWKGLEDIVYMDGGAYEEE